MQTMKDSSKDGEAQWTCGHCHSVNKSKVSEGILTGSVAAKELQFINTKCLVCNYYNYVPLLDFK